jgi:predicted O-methyltransferase YrrM
MFNDKELEIIKNDALENHIPIIMDDTLEVIEKRIEKIKPMKILEIGTAVGYSASCFAKATKEECKIDTIELDQERASIAKENIKKIGIEERINVIVGNAVDILPKLKEGYDMIFIDANKGKYPVFLQESIRLINNNGIIFADNVLYKGYVMSDYNKHKQRTAVRHLREYIKEITENENLETEILEVGDGLAITKVKK